MAQLKKTFVAVRKTISREILLSVLAVILFVLASWFVIRNFILLIDGLNKSFNGDFTEEQTITTFDREGFDELNLVKER